MIRIGLAPALAALLAAPLAAQQVNPAVTAGHESRRRGPAHYGKWLSAAVAVTLTGLGAREYVRSDQAYRQLLDTCRADTANCTFTPSGAYANAGSEQLYQTSLRLERRARVRLLAGQASLLLAAGLFLADHGRHADEPENIPYHISVEPRAGGAQVGVRLRF